MYHQFLRLLLWNRNLMLCYLSTAFRKHYYESSIIPEHFEIIKKYRNNIQKYFIYLTYMPSLDVPAVSQAPSLEQNPNSLLLVDVSVVHYTTD